MKIVVVIHSLGEMLGETLLGLMCHLDDLINERDELFVNGKKGIEQSANVQIPS